LYSGLIKMQWLQAPQWPHAYIFSLHRKIICALVLQVVSMINTIIVGHRTAKYVIIYFNLGNLHLNVSFRLYTQLLKWGGSEEIGVSLLI
jgi:hypothetical protein